MAVQIALPMSCYPPMPLWPPTLALGSPCSRPRWSLYLRLSLNYTQRPRVIMASPLVINISINKVFLKWRPQLQNSILQILYYPRLPKVSTYILVQRHLKAIRLQARVWQRGRSFDLVWKTPNPWEGGGVLLTPTPCTPMVGTLARGGHLLNYWQFSLNVMGHHKAAIVNVLVVFIRRTKVTSD